MGALPSLQGSSCQRTVGRIPQRTSKLMPLCVSRLIPVSTVGCFELLSVVLSYCRVLLGHWAVNVENAKQKEKE